MSTKFNSKTVVTEPMPNADERFSITHRQELLPNFTQAKLTQAKVGVIGAGGLGSWTAAALARLGVGVIEIYEPDVCEPTNFHRQLYFPKDTFKPKSFQMVKNIVPHCTGKTRITGFAHRFEELLAAGFQPEVDALFMGVDNNQGRRIAAAYCYANNKPLVNVAVDGRAEHAHIMIQETGKACIACMNPGYLQDRKAPCFVPSCIDCLFVADGLALFAVTSILLARPRDWNFRNVHLAGFMNDSPKLIDRNPICPLCSTVDV